MFKFLSVIILMIAGYAVNGVALKYLWNWFMVPVLGLPIISLMEAIGIGIVISFLTIQHIPENYGNKEDEEKEFFNFLVWVFYTPVIAISVGWIVHLFI